MLRVLGSALAAAMIQLIIQFRLMTIVHRRLTFHAVNHLFKQERRGPPTWWNPGLRSEDCLSKLKADIRVGFQIALVLGMGASVAGYVGCFKIVQSSTDTIGPLVWLVLELALSIIRLALWAFNPTTDDPPPPIVISSGQPPVAHDIGWNLEDVTVDMHAVVIDIPNAGEADESLMFEYLTQHLAVSEDHVQHVLGSDRNAIQAALQSIVKSPDIPRGSPIIIYISHHSENNEGSEWVGHNEHGMPYSEFFELVRRISETKGENVVVILDTNFPALEIDSEHESEPHVLITSCSAGQTPPRGILFTKELLNSLEEAAAKKLTYEEVVKKVANKMENQTPNCLGTFKKRLIFNGILARKRPRTVEDTELITSLISATLWNPKDPKTTTPSASRDTLGNRNGTATNGRRLLSV
ncbi:hypothetical protein B0H14DRAFT_2655317 [Mycena olivaceomarginata]|nr:hypothetical protein B0H14DRAFT_2655317 [Mycena olivaceomarginata]